MLRFTRQNEIMKYFFAILLNVLPSAALAHAHLLTSSPAKDGLVRIAPKEVILHLSEELETSMCKLEVKKLPNGEIVSQGDIQNDGEDKRTLKVALKPLPNEKSEYEVSWKAVSKDSHRMPGEYKFTFDPKVK